MYLSCSVVVQEEIILIGHSAGAHLSVMAVLELIIKRLIHTPLPPLATTSAVTSISESIRFDEQHFDGSSSENGATGASSGDISNGENGATGVPSGGGDAKPDPAANSSSFIFIEGQMPKNTDSFCVVEEGNDDRVSPHGGGSNGSDEVPDVASGSRPAGQVEDSADDAAEAGSEGDTGEATEALLAVEGGRLLSESQRQLKDLLNSVKAVVGAFAIVLCCMLYLPKTIGRMTVQTFKMLG